MCCWFLCLGGFVCFSFGIRDMNLRKTVAYEIGDTFCTKNILYIFCTFLFYP